MPFEITCGLHDDEREILSTLSHKVRVLSASQISCTWPSVGNARRLNRLEREGLVRSFTALVHPELPLRSPVATWKRGGTLPDFGEASNELRSRWTLSAVPALCFVASSMAARMFGGHGGRFPRESEETHDLHLAAVYLRIRSKDPRVAALWIKEEEIKKRRDSQGGKLPDAMVGSKKVIEFGGAYKKAKLIAFHEYCEAYGLEYEVW